MNLMISLFLSLFSLANPIFDQAVGKIRFQYQPHEDLGTSCTHEPTNQVHGYLVKCGHKEFLIHHFARPYQRKDQLSWEVLFWVTNRRNLKENEYVGASLWINAEPGSELNSIKLSQHVDGDTASLDLILNLPILDPTVRQR